MTPDAGPQLLELSKTLAEPKYKVRALRGYIRIARQLNMTPAERLAMCRAALAAAQRREEKSLAVERSGAWARRRRWPWPRRCSTTRTYRRPPERRSWRFPTRWSRRRRRKRKKRWRRS